MRQCSEPDPIAKPIFPSPPPPLSPRQGSGCAIEPCRSLIARDSTTGPVGATGHGRP